MNNTEQSRVSYRFSANAPLGTSYRPLIDVERGRMLMPAEVTATVDVTGEPGLAHVDIDLELIDRRYRITRLEATPPGGAGLDIEALRRVDITDAVAAGVAHKVVLESADGERYSSESPIDNPDPLWSVALTYSVAHAVGAPPTKAVAERLRISRDAAAQRVKRARDTGYLPLTEKGRAS